MTRKEKRLAVINDVLNSTHRKLVSNQYIRDISSKLFADFGKDAQKDITELDTTCSVCALGSCLLSTIKLYDKITFGDLHSIQYSCDKVKIRTLLNTVFSNEQIVLIEAAFEGKSYIASPTKINQNKLKRAFDFGRKYKTLSGRLKGIMKNMQKNDGIFKP